MPTVLLFDVDKTLVDTGGAGRRAVELALDQQYPGGHRWLDFPLSGMTDRLIVRQALRQGGRQGDAVEPVIEAYLTHLGREMSAAAHQYVVFPGVVNCLEQVVSRQEMAVAMGLGTGNVEPGARLKLKPGNLNRFFAFGGFGSDATQRSDLLAVGAARGAARLGVSVDRCRVVVIGDTPLDVAAALTIGAECIAVATGNFDEQTLRESGATQVFPDLTADGVLAALVGA